MKIVFNNKKLQKSFSSNKELVKKYGDQNAKKIALRMDTLKSAECLADISSIPPCRMHALSGDKSGCFAIDVKHPYRIIFEPHNCKKEDLENLKNITEILIVSIEDYH